MCKPTLVSFWDSNVIWLERLCVASMIEQGHPVVIYSYEANELSKKGLGAEIRDAREILDESDPAYCYIREKKFSLYSNIFRLAVLKSSLGIWVDLDCLMLKSLVPKRDYVFGFSSDKRINGAVLKLPSQSDVMTHYWEAITAHPLRIPWSTFPRRVRRNLEIIFGQGQPHPHFRTDIGPRALTYFLKKYGLLGYAESREVFYPLLVREANLLVGPEELVRSRLTESTVIVHAWAATLKNRGYAAEIPGKGTFLGEACRQFGIT